MLLQTLPDLVMKPPERHRHLPKRRRTDPVQVILQIGLSSLRVGNPLCQHDILSARLLINRRIISGPVILLCSSAHTLKQSPFLHMLCRLLRQSRHGHHHLQQITLSPRQA